MLESAKQRRRGDSGALQNPTWLLLCHCGMAVTTATDGTVGERVGVVVKTSDKMASPRKVGHSVNEPAVAGAEIDTEQSAGGGILSSIVGGRVA